MQNNNNIIFFTFLLFLYSIATVTDMAIMVTNFQSVDSKPTYFHCFNVTVENVHAAQDFVITLINLSIMFSHLNMTS